MRLNGFARLEPADAGGMAVHASDEPGLFVGAEGSGNEQLSLHLERAPSAVLGARRARASAQTGNR